MLEKRIPPLLLVLITAAAMWGVSTLTSPVLLDDTLRKVAAGVMFFVGALVVGLVCVFGIWLGVRRWF